MYELLCRYLLGFLEHGEEDLNGGLQVQGRVAGVVLQGFHPALFQYSKNINLNIFRSTVPVPICYVWKIYKLHNFSRIRTRVPW